MKTCSRTKEPRHSLGVQWTQLWAPSEGCPGSIPVRETGSKCLSRNKGGKSSVLKLRPCAANINNKHKKKPRSHMLWNMAKKEKKPSNPCFTMRNIMWLLEIKVTLILFHQCFLSHTSLSLNFQAFLLQAPEQLAKPLTTTVQNSVYTQPKASSAI